MYSWMDLLVVGAIVIGLALTLRGSDRAEERAARRSNNEETVERIHVRPGERSGKIFELGQRLESVANGRRQPGGKKVVVFEGTREDCEAMELGDRLNLARLAREGKLANIEVVFDERRKA